MRGSSSTRWIVLAAAATGLACTAVAAAPVTVFGGVDPGIGPGDDRPVTITAAAAFEAAATAGGSPLSRIDFESQASGAIGPGRTIGPGVHLSATNVWPAAGIAGADFAGTFNTTPGGSRHLWFLSALAAPGETIVSSLTFTFDRAIDAFGAMVTGSNADQTLGMSFDDGDAHALIVPPGEVGAAFIGVRSEGGRFSSVTFTQTWTNPYSNELIYWVGLDDLAYTHAVPLPSSAPLAALGLLALVARRWRAGAAGRAFGVAAMALAALLAARAEAQSVSVQDGSWTEASTWYLDNIPSAFSGALIKTKVSVAALAEARRVDVAGEVNVHAGSEGGLLVANIHVGLRGEGSGRMTVDSDPTVTAVISTGNVMVGDTADGVMEITRGKVYLADSQGFAGVLGIGSASYTIGPGESVHGSLRLAGPQSLLSIGSGDGAVGVGSFVSIANGVGTGTIEVEGGAALYADAAVYRGSMTVKDLGTTWAGRSAHVTDRLSVLQGAQATLGSISLVSDGDGTLDTHSGQLWIADPLTRVILSGGLTVNPTAPTGVDFHASLRRQALLTSRLGEVGGIGGVLVGEQAVWTMTESLRIRGQQNRLYIVEGGRVTAASLSVSPDSNPIQRGAEMLISGEGSGLVVSGNIDLQGLALSSQVEVSEGGRLEAGGRLRIGYSGTGGGFEQRGRSRLEVLGSGSRLAVGGALEVGEKDGATVRAAEGAVVSAGSIRLGTSSTGSSYAASEGLLDIGASVGASPVSAGFVDTAGGITFGRTGSLRFNHSDEVHVFGVALRSINAGDGRLEHHAGTTVLAADNAAFTGATRVYGGTLAVDGVLGSASVVVDGGAALGGSGRLLGTLVVREGGSLLPGRSPGVLAIEGDLQMDPDSTLVLEIGGTAAGAEHDRLVVQGDVGLAGATLALAFIDGFSPLAGQRFSLLDVAGSFVAPAQVTVSGLLEGWSYDLAFDGDAGSFTLWSLSDGVPVPSVPAPPSAWMLAAGLLTVGGWTRRRARAAAKAP
ncbi:MAG: hypothetical protein H6933_00045 [Burkholderiaceae bacterium]|nr:hypothetical protein [Burkholderiaceae bacterium]